jgi:carbamoyltransferase
VRGEPIVCTPHEAYLCFMRTNMDVLVMDRFVMYKPDQKPLEEDVDWRSLFALD